MISDKPLTLKDFAGDWHIDRVIASDDAPDVVFTGRAVWSPDGAQMRYREAGQLTLAGQAPIFAEREYLWTDDLQVFFPDGRFFHQVQLDGQESLHWCDPDTYRGRYDFSGWPVFSVTWDVQGPRKAYRSETTYRRL